MNWDSTDPATSRDRYASRGLTSKAKVGLLFLVAVGVWSMVCVMVFSQPVVPILIGDGAALFAAVLLDKVWSQRPLLLKCSGCGNLVSANTPWVCGFCKQPNLNAAKFPFVYQCEHCTGEPKAYRCHHEDCHELIFLSADKDKSNYAYALNARSEVPPPDMRQINQQTHEIVKENKLAQIEQAELDLKLKRIRAERSGPKMKSPAEIQQEQFDSAYASIMGTREFARQKEIEVREQYKDDPEGLAEALEVIKEVQRRYS